MLRDRGLERLKGNEEWIDAKWRKKGIKRRSSVQVKQNRGRVVTSTGGSSAVSLQAFLHLYLPFPYEVCITTHTYKHTHTQTHTIYTTSLQPGAVYRQTRSTTSSKSNIFCRRQEPWTSGLCSAAGSRLPVDIIRFVCPKAYGEKRAARRPSQLSRANIIFNSGRLNRLLCSPVVHRCRKGGFSHLLNCDMLCL